MGLARHLSICTSERGGASNLLKPFRDQAALHGRLEVETLDVVKPETITALRQRLAGRASTSCLSSQAVRVSLCLRT